MRKIRPLFVGCILVVVVITVSAVIAKSVPSKSNGGADYPEIEGFIFTEASQIAMVPWDEVNQEIAARSLTLPVRYFSSMGCTDISCTDFSHHTHWCSESCLDQSHGHSAAEYRIVEAELKLFDRTPVYLK